MKIWLDDIRPAPLDWEWCVTVWEALDLLVANTGSVEVMSFDHDLGDDELTGYDGLAALERMIGTGEMLPSVLPDRFEIHSANPVGRKNMQAAIDSIERMRDARTS